MLTFFLSVVNECDSGKRETKKDNEKNLERKFKVTYNYCLFSSKLPMHVFDVATKTFQPNKWS